MQVKYFSLKILMLGVFLASLNLNVYAQSAMPDTITSTNLPVPTQAPMSNPAPTQGNGNMPMPNSAPMQSTPMPRSPQGNRNMVAPMQQMMPPQNNVIVDQGGSLRMVAPSGQNKSEVSGKVGSTGGMSVDSTNPSLLQQPPMQRPSTQPNSSTQGK